MAQGTWRVDPEENAKLQEESTPWWSMPGVSEYWKTLTTPTEYHKPMKLGELSSKPESADELLSQYEAGGKGISAAYTDPEHGAGKLYVNKQTGGELRFLPVEKNQASYKQTAASFQAMEGVQQALQIAGMTGVGAQANRARKQQKQQGYNLAAEGAKNITPGKTAVKPNTAAGKLKYQSSRTEIGYDPVYRATEERGLNHKVANTLQMMRQERENKVELSRPPTIYTGEISTGDKPEATFSDLAWLSTQGKRLTKLLSKEDYDKDRAYNLLSTWSPFSRNIYQTMAAIPGLKQHHKFAKYASSAFVLRMMELAHQGKADIRDIIQLHSLSYHYSLPMGGGRWGIQDVESVPHTQGHTLARMMGWEHKGKPFQKVSAELLQLDTPEEVAYALVDFMVQKGKPSLEAMLELERDYKMTFKQLSPEELMAMKIKLLKQDIKNPKR